MMNENMNDATTAATAETAVPAEKRIEVGMGGKPAAIYAILSLVGEDGITEAKLASAVGTSPNGGTNPPLQWALAGRAARAWKVGREPTRWALRPGVKWDSVAGALVGPELDAEAFFEKKARKHGASAPRAPRKAAPAEKAAAAPAKDWRGVASRLWRALVTAKGGDVKAAAEAVKAVKRAEKAAEKAAELARKRADLERQMKELEAEEAAAL